MSKVIEGESKAPKLRPNTALQTTNPDPTGVRMIEQACADYALQLQDIWAAAQKRSEEAWAKYVGEAEAIYNAAATRFEELYRGYLSAVEKITAAEDPQSVAEAEYNELVRKAKEVWTPADNSKLYEAYSRYVNEYREAWSAENARPRCDDAYRSYIAAVQKGWGAVDANALSASKLAAIGDSLRTAASWGSALA
jgi:hypothetical protein